VVLNSISQYLPSIEYLLRVVAGAVESTAPGGFVFVGDVRSLPMLEAYHASVQTARAPESMGMADWTQRVREHLVQEEELAVDPAFFEVLRTELPRVSRVEVLVKRGHAENELTRFRYDVVLHVDGPVPEVSAPSEWLDWETEQLSLSGVLERLRSDPDRLSIRRVPDARLSAEAKMVEWLREPPVGATIGAARATLARRPEGDVEPEALWSLARELGYGVAVSYAGSGELGRLDVVFERRNGAADPGNRVSFPPRPQPVPKRWHQYATNPLRGRILADLVPSLRAHAESRLPEYMVPAAFVVLDAMPRNRSGKIDRPALPAPTGRRQLGTAFVGPRNPVEEQLVAIYREVLQLEQVGVHDNFFELGGHSLLATQVMSRIRDVCHRDVPLRELFEEPTVAGLARRLDAAAVQGRPAPPMRRQPRAGRRLP
jgi:hypothetical protein